MHDHLKSERYWVAAQPRLLGVYSKATDSVMSGNASCGIRSILGIWGGTEKSQSVMHQAVLNGGMQRVNEQRVIEDTRKLGKPDTSRHVVVLLILSLLFPLQLFRQLFLFCFYTIFKQTLVVRERVEATFENTGKIYLGFYNGRCKTSTGKHNDLYSLS